MNNHKLTIDKWIEYVSSEWLNQRGMPSLRPSTQNFIHKMEEMSRDHTQYDEAWKYIQELEMLHTRFHDENRIYSKESSHTLIKCAVAAYTMGNTHEAIRLFTGAIANSNDDAHDKAVIHWMRGCVYWYEEDLVNAITDWEDSLNEFKEQATVSQRDAVLASWYGPKIKEMDIAIKSATENKFPDPPLHFDARKGADEKTHSLKSIPIIGEIPAGTPRGVLPSGVGQMETQDVILDDGRHHRIVSLLQGKRFISLPHSQDFYILKVVGNSMNQATPEPINDGDYVLMRAQNAPDNGDIVAAEIISGDGKDDRATLKRFMKMENGKIFLIPESSDPEFRERIDPDQYFTKLDEGFYIRGVALAVFKRMQ